MNYLSAIDLSKAIKNKEVSCLEVMRASLERIEILNPLYNAIVALADRESLLQLAQLADDALYRGEYWGWMHGMPHAVKDLANVKGFVTSCGSTLLSDAVAPEDDVFVRRLRAQGAIFIGKTNVPEFGMGSHTYNNLYGSTKNAFDISLTAGGSSGGAATALATGMLAVADGSDMMGSLRNPAAYNNIVGFRPSMGRIPRAGGDVFFAQLPSDGPMGRTVSDVIQLFLTLAGYDESAPLSMQADLPALEDFKPLKLADTKIAWLGDFDGYLAMDDGILDQCEATLRQLEPAGLRFENYNLNFPMADLWQSWLTLRHWFVYNSPNPLFKQAESIAILKPELQWEIKQGKGLSAVDIANAGLVRSDWYRALEDAFKKVDIIALPSAQVYPFPVEQHWPKDIAGKQMDTYHRWMEVTIGGTLSGCPVISLPAGFDKQNRPMGIQFIAPMGQDKKLLEFAMAFEEVRPWADYYKDIVNIQK